MLDPLRKRDVLGIPALLLLILAILYFLTRLPLLGYLPFIQDEAIYAVMIGEQQDGLTVIPTLFGYPISWKMAPFFWLYSALAPLSSGVGLEGGFRFPSVVFGFLCLIPLFLILKHFSDEKLAFLSSVFYLVSFVSVYPNTSLLIDSPAFLLILLSLYFYAVKGNPLAGGALAAAAFTFKLVTAFISPLLAMGYFILLGKREALTNRVFIASLSLPLLAALANYAILSPFGGGDQVYFEELLPRLLTSGGQADLVTRVSMSLDTLAYSMGPVFLVSLFGFAKNWRGNRFMSFWYALTIIPFLAATQYPWYYLPVLPAVSFFAALAVYDFRKAWKENLPGLLAAAAICAISLMLVWGAYQALFNLHNPERVIGTAIAGKENVLIIGHFKPGIIAYKELNERGHMGRPLDYGFILGPPSFGGEEAAAFVRDYGTGAVPATNGSFSGMYTSASVFRKDTNITDFDYLVLAGDLGFGFTGPEILVRAGDITVYKKPGAP
ncbi:MAG: hypothetical protein WC551_12070 [Patescibacteria group bacterium]